jgi:hypothetical protein
MRYKFLRWLAPALCALVGFVGFAPSAHAAWTMEALKWKRWTPVAVPYSYGGHVFTQDTTWVSGTTTSGLTDTTSSWSMLDADVMPASDYGTVATTGDSTIAGYFIVTADSNVASTVIFKATTVQFQVNYGTNNGGWQTFSAAAYPIAPDDGVKVICVPLLSRFLSITNDLGPTTGAALSQPNTIFAPNVRAIVSWGASNTAVPMARCYVKKYIKNINVQRSSQPYSPINN